MKKLHPLLSVLFLISFVFSQRPVKNEVVSERHPNGLKKLVLVFEGTGLNELLVGKYGFYDSGIKEFVEFYKNNKKDGKSFNWYRNGNQKSEFNYINGKMNGSQIDWYENGQKKTEHTYKNEELDGLSTIWYENGQKQAEGTFKDGEKISEKQWYKDGSVKE